MFKFVAVTDHNFFQLIFGNSLLSFLVNLIFIIAVLYFLYKLIFFHLINQLLDWFDFNRLKKKSIIFLELIPPNQEFKSNQETARLFSSLYSLTRQTSFKDQLLRRRKPISLELVSTRTDGIRFIVGLNQDDLILFKQLIESFIPEITINEIVDYLPSDFNQLNWQMTEFCQSDKSIYPLASQSDKADDVLSYLIGSMVMPEANELIALQMIISPLDNLTSNRIRRQSLNNQKPKLIQHGGFWLFRLIKLIFISIVVLNDRLLHFIFKSPKYWQTNHPPKASSTILQALVETKLNQPLFYVNLRALVIGDQPAQRIKGLQNALAVLRLPGYQELVSKKSFNYPLILKHQLMTYQQRLPSILSYNSNILASSELADIYHFPNLTSGFNEVVQTMSKVLPVPLAIKNLADNNDFDVVFGVNHYHGKDTLIGLTKEDRQRHVYILGGSGNGKTTLIKSAITQDIKAGKGLAVIDPHGDLAESILKYIPEDRIKDVIYFNPKDITYPIGLNLLEQPKDLNPDDLLLEQDFITEAIVSIFRKIFSENDHGGHRIEHFLRNTIHTAFNVPDATLFTVYKLLTNTKFRRSIVDQLTDEDLKDFWAGEFNNAGDYQKVKMSSGVNAKLGRFQRSVVSRRILEQTKSTINFDQIIQNKQILICNFAKGQIGEDTSSLLGISVLAKLQLAALRRARLSESNRTPFYLYVDEFQNFATVSFVQLLSEARKYRLFLTMAEQSTAQQEEKRLIDIMLANIGTIICFRTGSPQDEKLLLPIFKPQLNVGDIANLPAYNFYMRLRAINSLEPTSAQTILLDNNGNQDITNQVIESSRNKYTKKYIEPKEKIVIESHSKKYSTKPKVKSLLSPSKKSIKPDN